MKKMLCLAMLALCAGTAFAYNYETGVPLPGKTIADEKLQQDTMYTVYMYTHRVATPDCQSFVITDTNVSKAKADDKWQEIWTVKACSKTANIPVNFELKDNGTQHSIDYMNVKVSTTAQK